MIRCGTTSQRYRSAAAAIALLWWVVSPVVSHAQEYPARPVRMIVASSPGGGTDAVARILGGRLAKLLGQQFVIDNRAGAGGIAGTEAVARALPDGYTLLMGSISALVLSPALVRTSYDPVRDFTPVGLVVSSQYLITIHPSVPARTLKDFVAYAKAHPGRINYASAGNGTPVHLAAELFNSMTGVSMVHIAYKGGGPAAMAVVSGEAQLIFGSVASTLPQVKAGRLVALATTGAARLAAAPEYPTVAELGYPGFEVTSWYGVVGPARMPSHVVTRLNTAILSALGNADVREQMTRQGLDVIGSSPAVFAAHLKRETAMWARVVKDAGIKGDES